MVEAPVVAQPPQTPRATLADGSSFLTAIRFRRFKKFANQRLTLSEGVTLVAGGNNSGKSTLLHGLAIWQFCRTAIEMEKGSDAFLSGAHSQGTGLGDDEFSPIAIPSLKHLWTNLKTQRQAEDPDGYTLRISAEWGDVTSTASSKVLEFGLALANDRLFIKVTNSTLSTGDSIPVIAYLPPFAGMTDREMKVSEAIRRRRIGEGLAGAVLRNILLEMYNANESQRVRLREGQSKIKDSDLRRLRENDPWELLQQTLRTRFSVELIVDPFLEAYHSYIRVDVDRGSVSGYKLKRHAGYNRRDLMVEGSGFLQWLSVYALAVSPSVDVLLLDEPDAHLHPALQMQLVESLNALSLKTNKQVLVATHSSELLRDSHPERILEIRTGREPRYLRTNEQKVGLMAGLGSDYAPRIDAIRKHHRVLFLEGTSDEQILARIAAVAGVAFPCDCPIWFTSESHKDRRKLFSALREDIPDLVAMSLRDRDDESIGTTTPDLDDKVLPGDGLFLTLKWRRRYIESYLIVPAAIARMVGRPTQEIESDLAVNFGYATAATFFDSDCPTAFLDAHGKDVLSGPSGLLKGTRYGAADVAANLQQDELCVDLTTFLRRFANWVTVSHDWVESSAVPGAATGAEAARSEARTAGAQGVPAGGAGA